MAVLYRFITILAVSRRRNAFVVAWQRIFTDLADNLAFARVDVLMTMIANAVG